MLTMMKMMFGFKDLDLKCIPKFREQVSMDGFIKLLAFIESRDDYIFKYRKGEDCIYHDWHKRGADNRRGQIGCLVAWYFRRPGDENDYSFHARQGERCLAYHMRDVYPHAVSTSDDIRNIFTRILRTMYEEHDVDPPNWLRWDDDVFERVWKHFPPSVVFRRFVQDCEAEKEMSHASNRMEKEAVNV